VPGIRVEFLPSGRAVRVRDGTSLLEAAEKAGEPVNAECGGRGACGRCLMQIEKGEVPGYRVIHRESGSARVLACLTPVRSPLTVNPLREEADLPGLTAARPAAGVAPLSLWSPWPLSLDPVVEPAGARNLGVALDAGTTTLRLLVIRLTDGTVVAEAVAYNPQIRYGADVISRIIAAEKGRLSILGSSIRTAITDLIGEASVEAGFDPDDICGYMVAGNLTMIHLLLGEDPSGIRQVPSRPAALSFSPRSASSIDLPGGDKALVFSLPAAGGWVGGDILAGAARAGFPRRGDSTALYVDLGTNGEIVLGGADFAMACACSAGPAFEGGGIVCGMRADNGAVNGARIDAGKGELTLSVIGGGTIRGICGSGLITLAAEMFRAGWIDKSARFTEEMPASYRVKGKMGTALSLSDDGKVALWERDLASLIRAKAAIFAGIRTLLGALGEDALRIDRIMVSGNFGRFLNLPAATGIGLLPDFPPDRYHYIDNGALEGAALAMLSRDFLAESEAYLKKITYIDLADLPGYMDEFTAASFLPHTDPGRLRL